MKTLVVEDDFTSRLLLQTFLADFGECHVAVNGREAVLAFDASIKKGKPYDLICLDIMLPELSGHEVLKSIREIEERADLALEHGAKVIMTSALSDMKTVVSSFRELCDAYLVKPIDTQELVNHLRSFKLIS